MKRWATFLIATILACSAAGGAAAKLPPDFVYLSDVVPSIAQDIRYAGYHNFLGRPVLGYEAPVCILTERAARALAAVQSDLEDAGLTLRVYDCYRPQRAVYDFVAWSKLKSDQRMKGEYYPRVDKSQFLTLGYLQTKSSHSRGSAVDLTIVRLPMRPIEPYAPGNRLHSCIGPYARRYHDGSIDMGTAFDCMDELSHVDADVGNVAGSHRSILRTEMEKHGFAGDPEEWWHYTLKDEPFPHTYFDFPIEAK